MQSFCFESALVRAVDEARAEGAAAESRIQERAILPRPADWVAMATSHRPQPPLAHGIVTVSEVALALALVIEVAGTQDVDWIPDDMNGDHRALVLQVALDVLLGVILAPEAVHGRVKLLGPGARGVDGGD